MADDTTDLAEHDQGLLEKLGTRATTRPLPRAGISLAGAGAAFLVVGAISMGGDQLSGPSSGGGGSQVPGALITLGVIIVGVVVTAHYRNGPMAAAGVAASAVALPAFLEFASYSRNSAPSFNTILFLSSAGWVLAYLVGPGRGHAFYLALSLVGAVLWFLEASEHVFSSPITLTRGAADLFSLGVDQDSSAPVRFGHTPDATTVGVYTLFFAVAYLVVCVLLDRRAHHAMATPFAFAGDLALVSGILLLADDLEQIGTGIALAVGGLVLVFLGATSARRGTNWTGAGLVFVGVTVVILDPINSAGAFGVVEMLVGAIVIAGAHLIATRLHEPPETEYARSRFYRAGSVQPSDPPPPPAGSVLG